MRVILKPKLCVVAPETDAERVALADWKAAAAGHALLVSTAAETGLRLHDLGPRQEVAREPLNVTSRSTDPQTRLIGNFAETPFVLDERWFRAVEGFWQGLKSTDPAERGRFAQMTGAEAKRAGAKLPYGAEVEYGGEAIPVGTWRHWALMERACEAKFTQNDAARAALLATGERPLEHRLRRDSKTIPGVILAEIWTRLRAKLRRREGYPPNSSP